MIFVPVPITSTLDDALEVVGLSRGLAITRLEVGWSRVLNTAESLGLLVTTKKNETL